MIETDARSILGCNTPRDSRWSESSFIARLHEDAVFDEKRFAELIAALNALDRDCRTTLDTVLVYRIFRYTMLLFCCHFDARDAFAFDRMSTDQIWDCRDRFVDAFDRWFDACQAGG